MMAVYRRELSSCLHSLTGALFLTFQLLIVGIYGAVLHFYAGYAEFENVVSQISVLYLLLVPILTMRTFAEERKQKTDQLLYSLPLTMRQIVLGKYFALLTMLAIPVAIMCLWPLILGLYGTVTYASAYAAILGYFLLGAALLALGMYLSSLTDSQILSAVICFAVLLLLYMMDGISGVLSTSGAAAFVILSVLLVAFMLLVRRFTQSTWLAIALGLALEIPLAAVCLLDVSLLSGAIQSLLSALAIFSRLDYFVLGLVDVGGAVYLLTVAGLFLFFSVQTMEKRRWS